MKIFNSLLALSAGDVLTVFNSLFFILGGVTVFMIGMNMMGHNIEKAAGKSIRRLMGKATVNRFAGVGTGAAVTALVNSSAATTVMIIGFVNVGLMTLVQATSVIMGANIGTTISAFIMALSSASGAQLSMAAIFALVAFVGFVFTIAGKTDRLKQIGCILEGIGLIFIGLNVMSRAVNDLLDPGKGTIRAAIENLFQGLGNGKSTLTWEIIVLFLLGVLLTALMQSSGALTAIVISLASADLISLQMAMCIILGTNVGTCFTSLLSSMGANANAKRAAVIHLLFNVTGTLIFIFPVAFAGNYIANFFSLFIAQTQWQIAVFHMVFNILTTAILLPFIKYLVKISTLLVHDKSENTTEENETLDPRLLKTPAIAVGQVRKQLLTMADLAFSNYKLSLEMLMSGDTSKMEEFAKVEDSINANNSNIVHYLIELSLQELSKKDEKKVSSFFRVSSDLERIGDYAENITEFAEKKAEQNLDFSEHAMVEIQEMDSHLTNLFKHATDVFRYSDLSYIPEVEFEENETDRMNKVMQKSHLRRMKEGRCSPETGAIFLQLAVTMERIGDHMHNIANSVLEYGHKAVSAKKSEKKTVKTQQ